MILYDKAPRRFAFFNKLEGRYPMGEVERISALPIDDYWQAKRYLIQDADSRSLAITTQTMEPDPDTVIGSESFTLDLIDRSIGYVDGEFAKHLGGIENTPSYVAIQIARARGEVAIADIGCGTGNTLFTEGKLIAEKAPLAIENVHMTGISREDYSGVSAHQDTRIACQGTETSPPTVNYVIGDATNMQEIADNSQDVVHAYNAMIHTTQPVEWLSEMIRITRPGGTIFFNTPSGQLSESYLAELRASGYSILPIELPDRGPFPPSEYDLQFFRLDVPVKYNKD